MLAVVKGVVYNFDLTSLPDEYPLTISASTPLYSRPRQDEVTIDRVEPRGLSVEVGLSSSYTTLHYLSAKSLCMGGSLRVVDPENEATSTARSTNPGGSSSTAVASTPLTPATTTTSSSATGTDTELEPLPPGPDAFCQGKDDGTPCSFDIVFHESDRYRVLSGHIVQHIAPFGERDLVSAAQLDNSIYVHLFVPGLAGRPTGYYESILMTDQATLVSDVAVGDIDGDGHDDIVACQYVPHGQTIFAYMGTGDRYEPFLSRTPARLGPTAAEFVGVPRTLALADADNDGNVDIITVGTSAGGAQRSLGRVAWLLNAHGNLTFDVAVLDTVGQEVWKVRAAHLDADGRIDVALIAGMRDVFVYRSVPGALAGYAKQSVTGSFTGPRDLQVADVNGDGREDLVVVGHTRGTNDLSTVAWYENSPDGVWHEHVIDEDTLGASTVSVADMNGDGYLDVVVAFYDDSNIVVFVNDGRGNFPTTRELLGGVGRPLAVLATDITGDGGPDLVYSSVLDRCV